MPLVADPVEVLSRAFDQTGAVVAAVTPDQHDLPTPCSAWDVRRLLAHIMGGLAQFESQAKGGPPQDAWQVPLEEDLAAQYADLAASILDAWRQPGALERIVALPFGELPGHAAVEIQVLEEVVHGWDLARATGNLDLLGDDLAGHTLGVAQMAIPDALRGEDGAPFGPRIEPAPDAPPYHRLAGFLGRRP
ncbi:MAG TPA: TIGR03086 family metal-binding protein [Candidatus Dormibacteraeota bacterium]